MGNPKAFELANRVAKLMRGLIARLQRSARPVVILQQGVDDFQKCFIDSTALRFGLPRRGVNPEIDREVSQNR
jgi:hypothetical protein